MGWNRHRRARLISLPEVAAIELVSVSIAAMIWALDPRAGAWPLLVLLLPWILYPVAGRFPLRRTPLDLPLALFLLTAGLAIWAAYDPDAARGKFWLLLASLFLFQAIVKQPLSNYGMMAGLLLLWGVFYGGFFMLGHDWRAQPADLEAISRMGLRWMEIRPALPVATIHPNIAGGVLAAVAPISVAALLYALHRGRTLTSMFFGLGLITSAFLLFMTSSRAAWLALAVALGGWFLWSVLRRALPEGGRHARWIMAGLLVFVVLAGLALFLIAPGRVMIALNQLPGPASARSRLEVFQDSLHLAGDYLMLGGGLNAFPGLYSEYILVIPHLFLGYAHNLFLDVLIEQGVIGLIAFLGIIVGSLWLLIARIWQGESRSLRVSLTRWAALCGLGVLVLHGMLDDPLYGMGGTPLLFALPALAVAIASPGEDRTARAAEPTDTPARSRAWGWLGVIAGLAALAFVTRHPLGALWQANVGAAEMARITLADWPTGVWDEGKDAARLTRPEARFQAALDALPENRTAHHRLGLLAMFRQEYETAAVHLERAYERDPNHRGIQKSLGYTYVWLGNYDQALPLLEPIPEIRQELEVYSWWWETQGRSDLAARAAEMVVRLDPTHTSIDRLVKHSSYDP